MCSNKCTHLNILMTLADGSYSISSTTFSSFKSGKQSSASLHWLQCSMTFSWQEDKNSWSDCVSEDIWDLISSSEKDGDKSWNQSQIQASYLTLVLKDLFTIKWKICHYLLSRCSKPIRLFSSMENKGRNFYRIQIKMNSRQQLSSFTRMQKLHKSIKERQI